MSSSLLLLLLLFVIGCAGLRCVSATTVEDWIGTWTESDYGFFGNSTYICHGNDPDTLFSTYALMAVQYGSLSADKKTWEGTWVEGGASAAGPTGVFKVTLNNAHDELDGFWWYPEDPNTKYTFKEKKVSSNTPTARMCMQFEDETMHGDALDLANQWQPLVAEEGEKVQLCVVDDDDMLVSGTWFTLQHAQEDPLVLASVVGKCLKDGICVTNTTDSGVVGLELWRVNEQGSMLLSLASDSTSFEDARGPVMHHLTRCNEDGYDEHFVCDATDGSVQEVTVSGDDDGHGVDAVVVVIVAVLCVIVGLVLGAVAASVYLKRKRGGQTAQDSSMYAVNA